MTTIKICEDESNDESRRFRQDVITRAVNVVDTKELSRVEVSILRDHAVQLSNTNDSQTKRIKDQDKIIQAQTDKIKRLQSKLKERNAFIEQQRKVCDKQTRLHNEARKCVKSLEKELKQAEDRFEKASKGIVDVVRHMFLHVRRINDVTKTHGRRMMEKGKVEAGEPPCAYTEDILDDEYHDANFHESQQRNVVNGLLKKLTDKSGISFAGAWEFAEEQMRSGQRS
ncbi:hypothetical protein PFICI_11571 [Pestalotiopsis fici W106-1]|uniref:Uncharacterized protein n=1 Tax=Pestalotiopsis fici (strain W106-1 / CGMCC3.15140) TaxID=1229662 RepID=W3WQT5_PESFW|nr:uncharacterized protein PFICI_11571 [Pestalotiopsis fici W106-1]ETS76184.1 hypothetical protein PFICI_11571 [Pestalotiopsis fici W106-1]